MGLILAAQNLKLALKIVNILTHTKAFRLIHFKCDGIKDTEHFVLLCPSFHTQRRDFLAGIIELLRPFV